jgi:DnaJ-domain-containing protein 1
MTTTTLSPADFEKALKLACLRAVARVKYHDPFTHGDRSAVRDGALIGDIADEAGISIHMARRRLQALQAEGKVIRDDRRGGSTAWWLVGLADTHRIAVPAVVAPVAAPARQALTTAAPAQREQWWKVLGVARDASTSEVREAFRDCMNGVPDYDLDADQQRQRIRAAYNARLTEDGISEYE